MTLEDKPKPNEDMMSFLRRKRQFSDLVLLGWSTIEFDIDQLVMSTFGLRWGDKKGKILLDMTFNKKLQFLKEDEVFDKMEFKALKEFQEYRNRLFHGQEVFYIYTESEKDKIMDMVIKATNLVHHRLFQKRK